LGEILMQEHINDLANTIAKHIVSRVQNFPVKLVNLKAKAIINSDTFEPEYHVYAVVNQ
jgi:hypothetical protein